MGLLSRLSTELRSAGHAARGTIDEAKVRLELFRVRQAADKAAQALGYEFHRSTKAGSGVDPDTLRRLGAALEEHETEAHNLEEELKRLNAMPGPAPGAPGEGAAP